MNIGIYIELGIGIMSLVLGYLIWKKEKISLLHSYHYTKVKEEDKKEYCKYMGITNILIGMGLVLMGFIDYFFMGYGMIAFGIFFIIAMVLFVRTQKKYNGGIF